MAGKGKKAQDLPPTMDAFRLHLKCAELQLMIWRNAIVPWHEDLDSTKYDFEKDSELLQAQMMTEGLAASEQPCTDQRF